MKILLVGEYSRLHNSLKEGLLALGHQVTIVASGDNFKQFPVDFSIAPHYLSKRFLKFPRKVLIRLFKFDILEIERYFRYKLYEKNFVNYDVVQLINSNALEIEPNKQIGIYRRLFARNKKVFLLVCGEDTVVIDELLKNNLRYSILTPYIDDNSLKITYSYSLKYVTEKYRTQFDFVKNNVDGIIASDLDYKIPLENSGTQFSFIPNPINTDKIKFQELEDNGLLVIFLGVNSLSSIKKGTSYFQKALELIKTKYGQRVKIIVSENLPYDQYMLAYNSAHIVFDQCFAYDQGYNALEAMARGKVVFTGAESEFYEYYKIAERVAVNAMADSNIIAEQLSFLIDNPDEIILMGRRARKFVEQNHQYIRVAESYLKVWEKL